MLSPYFSIIVPIYNAEPYLEQCLHSVLHQDYDDFELLLINDCSTDGSGKYCEVLSATASNIRVIHHKENKGVSRSRNAGIDAASGSYIIFLDSDDYLLDDCLSGIEEHIRGNESPDVVVGRHIGNYPYSNNDYFFHIDKEGVNALLAHITDTRAQPNFVFQFINFNRKYSFIFAFMNFSF